MRHRRGVLSVEIGALAGAHLVGGEVVQSGGVVVAERVCALVVGVSAVNVGPDHIYTVYLPRERSDESLVPADTLERLHRKLPPTGLVFPVHRVQQHATRTGVAFKSAQGLFQAVGGHPVVTVEIGHIPSARPFQTLIAGKGLSAVGCEGHHLDARVGGLVTPQDGGRAVGRGIIDTYHLNVVQRLPTKRVETPVEKLLGVVHSDEYGHHDISHLTLLSPFGAIAVPPFLSARSTGLSSTAVCSSRRREMPTTAEGPRPSRPPRATQR